VLAEKREKSLIWLMKPAKKAWRKWLQLAGSMKAGGTSAQHRLASQSASQ